MDRPVPTVSIGLPVYNGAATLRCALDSLLRQSFVDFEIVISDNASTDETAEICAEYAAADARIRYVRQLSNVGGELNFKSALEHARARYFMWAACDDIRSSDFLEENVRYLEAHPGSIASTSPNCFEGHDPVGANLVTFSIEGDIAERFNAFLDNSWQSHGIFYSLVRTDVLKQCDVIGRRFLGSDWAIDLFLASRGDIHRSQKGLTVFGRAGVSSQSNGWRRFRTSTIGWILPFYRFSIYALALSSGFTLAQRAALLKRLLKLNGWAAYSQLRTELHSFHLSYIKPWVKSSLMPHA